MARREVVRRIVGGRRRAHRGRGVGPGVVVAVALAVAGVALAVVLAVGGPSSRGDAAAGPAPETSAPRPSPSSTSGLPAPEPSTPAPPDADPLWRATFPDDGLVSNELAYREPDDPDVTRSQDWIVTSGSLFADDGAGTSGSIDGGSPDALSEDDTGSAVLRAVTRRTFGDVRVDLDLRVEDMTTTKRTPAVDFDGVHLFVRYASGENLYSVDLCRRDGTATIKRKSPNEDSENGGDYVTLAEGRLSCPTGEWRPMAVIVADVEDGVAITLLDGDREVLSVVDEGDDSPPPLTGPGRIGLRGDNTKFSFRDLTVSAVDPS